MPKRKSTEAPDNVTTAENRGQMLRHLISRTGKNLTVFQQEAQLPRSTLNALLDGTNDVIKAEKRTAQAIQLALGMYDDDVIEALGLPPEVQRNWYTARPAPFGHGDYVLDEHRHLIRLDRPLMGDVVLPAETLVTIDTTTRDYGIQLVKLVSGEFFAMKSGPAASAAGRVIGRLLSADFGAVLPVDVPLQEHAQN
ncbi:hypothetical protein D3875_02990 [Deinococcus cavernae]|uniref:Uncharacterized protein n=1 Tax=Deinococcus cavernae TaxID=2320857 RepID=A0A418VFV8_9DEIO|nr:hypothetical protein [Deinococcus cavernae]RJF74978.1 hypothetical protein D3875_02990 [Deinococcus cavernae]